MTRASEGGPTPLTRDPHRFRLSRAGIHQVWQYDEVFRFGGGRLLLRGKNGAGKSKALEMLLPFLLDGDQRRLDATGGGKTTLKWLMLDGWSGGTNRLGYLWVEFVRDTENGRSERLTLGVGIRASTSTGDARPTFFVTPRTVGKGDGDLPLHDPEHRPSLAELRELVGSDCCFERAADYRARVARELFGISDQSRYRNLVHLLYGLRRPTIGDRIESGGLVKVLGDALPPLDDDVLDNVARNLDDLDTVRAELARLERTDSALTTFLTSYKGYLRGVLRERVGQVTTDLDELRACRKQAGNAVRDLVAARAEEDQKKAAVEAVEDECAEADADLNALRDSAAYGALQELRDRRETVKAKRETAQATWAAADFARTAESAAAAHLSGEVEQLGRELGDLRTSLVNARSLSRSCGVDDALLADAPSARAEQIAAASEETLTDPDGDERVVERPSVAVLGERIGAELTAWGERLGEAGRVVKARRRAAKALREQVAKVAAAEETARALGQATETAEKQLDDSGGRERDRGTELVAASEEYAGEVREWAARFPDHDPLGQAVGDRLTSLVATGEVEGPPAELALGRDVPEAVAHAAEEIAEPWSRVWEAERDDALTEERELSSELARKRAEHEQLERNPEPEPDRSRFSTAARIPDTGAPLYRLLDFSPGLDDTERAGLEAALEASGLLDAWVSADGKVLAADERDVLLVPDSSPVPARSLGEVLRPVPGHGVSERTVGRVLASIGLEETPEAQSWISTDGRWRLGVARGAYGKDEAEFVGAGVRAQTRRRRLAELAEAIDALGDALKTVRERRKTIERRREELRRALREAPRSGPLTSAWTAYELAVAETSRLSAELSRARKNAEQARANAVRLRTRAEASATADGLPVDPEELNLFDRELTRLHSTLDVLVQNAGNLGHRLSAHTGRLAAWQEARQKRRSSEGKYASARTAMLTAQRELEQLEQSVGASEQDLIDREREARNRRDSAVAALPHCRDQYEQARDTRVQAEARSEEKTTALEVQERRTVEGSDRLRGPLGMPGLPLAAELGDVSAALEAYDSVHDAPARTRIKALRALADDIAGRLGPASADIGGSAILKRSDELRDGLAGGYDAGIEEIDGIKRFWLHDDSGAHDVAAVGGRIRTAAEQARLRLSSREQEVFERYLLGELGDHLSQQVFAAHRLVDAMNKTLDDVRSSHGIGARLVWELPENAHADVRSAVELLRSPAALRSRDQSTRLREALRRRIEDARLADPSAGYATHLRTALDYRTWFAFRVKVTDAARPDRVRVLSHRTALSQGEQRVVSYLVLFATAAAHFSSLAGSARHAPRLILLDDAFAKVDEPTHGRLLGLLVDLDLDFVITSERLWGCFPTVPNLEIYECLRDPRVRGVATVHYTWNGSRKRLVSV
ncbi:TIGR02680 family protein [Spirillospora sp. NPDC049652]